MSTRPVQNIREYSQAERRPVPAWVPTMVITLSVLLATNFGIFMYGKGQTDLLLAQHSEALKTVQELKEQNKELKGKLDSYDDLDQWVGLLVVYEQGLREKLAPITEKYHIELPPMPPRPTHRKGN